MLRGAQALPGVGRMAVLSNYATDDMRERCLALGETIGHLATQLCLSVKTVSTYRSRVMEKMHLASNSDLTHYALTNGLIR